VFTLHDLQEIYYPEYFSKEVRIWRRFIYKKLTKLAFKIITESSHVKNDITRLYKNAKDKVHVIESPPYFKFDKIKESPFNFPYIFFPAQFWKHKNHIRVLKAFKKIKECNTKIKLVLTGSKSREFNNIQKEVIDLNLQDDVIFKGPIPQDEMSTFFSKAKLIIAPTLYESISIPVFEAFKYQVPVCASGVYAIKDQVKNAGILFDPKDIKSIFTSMNLGLTDQNLRKKCIKNGNKRLEFFSHSRFNSLLKKVIDEN
jgi:glycosyltransferase involved in cell wall biosynthesis